MGRRAGDATDDDAGSRRRYSHPLKVGSTDGASSCTCRARGGTNAQHVASFLARCKGAFDAVPGSERVFVGLARREPVSHGAAVPEGEEVGVTRKSRRAEFPLLHLLHRLELETSRHGDRDPRLVISLGPNLTWAPDEDDAPRLVLVTGPRDPQQPRGSGGERQVELLDRDVTLERDPRGRGFDLVLSPPKNDAMRFAQVALGKVASGGCVVSARLPAASVAFVAADRGYRTREGCLCQIPAPVKGLAFAHLSYLSPKKDEEAAEGEEGEEDEEDVAPARPPVPADAQTRFDAMCVWLLSKDEHAHFTNARCPEVRRQEYRCAAEERLRAIMEWLQPYLGLGAEARDLLPGPITAIVDERAQGLVRARLAVLRDECDL